MMSVAVLSAEQHSGDGKYTDRESMKTRALLVAIASCSVASAESTGFVDSVKKLFGDDSSSEAAGSTTQAGSRSATFQDLTVDDNACVYK